MNDIALYILIYAVGAILCMLFVATATGRLTVSDLRMCVCMWWLMLFLIGGATLFAADGDEEIWKRKE